MPNPSQSGTSLAQTPPRQRERRRGRSTQTRINGSNDATLEVDVGQQLRNLRAERGLSIRALALQSGLNANTLSLIENGRTSPSVSTLQQLGGALQVPITAFFEMDTPQNNIAYQKAGSRLQVPFAHGALSDLGAGLTLRGGQPFLVTLEPKANSGSTPIVHTGHEFVFCLEGQLLYTIEMGTYLLNPGDSLLFAAHLPHCWQNVGDTTSRSLLIMCPTDESDHPTERHFKPDHSTGSGTP